MACNQIPISGDVGTVTESCIATSFEWTIYDYFIHEYELTKEFTSDALLIKSPPFKAFGASWNLYINPSMQLSIENAPWIIIGLFSKDHSIYSKCSWKYEISIIGRNAEHFMPFGKTPYLQDNTNVCKNVYYGMAREHFMQNKNKFVPSNILTIFCHAVLQVPAKKIFQAVFLKSPKILETNMMDLLHNGKYSDLKVKVKDEVFNVHKAIICAGCPSLFARYEKIINDPKCNNTVKISDCDPEVVEVFLHYLYTGQIISRSPAIAYQLFLYACRFNVNGMKTSCALVMQNNLSVETFCNIYCLAHCYKETELKVSARMFFRSNVQELLASDMWMSFVLLNPLLVNELLIEIRPYSLGLKRKLIESVIERKKLRL